MRKAILFGTMAAIISCALPAGAREIKPFEPTPGKWVQKSKAEPKEWRFTKPDASRNIKKVAPAEDVRFESTNGFSYLDMPDGSIWFVELNYDREVVAEFYGGAKDYHYKGIKGTVYDNTLNKYSEIDFSIDLPEGMEKCTSIDLGSLVTKQFFNYDTNYEIIFTAYFKPKDAYGAIPYTYVVSLKTDGTPSGLVSSMPGYYISAVNLATDKWSEDYYFQFYSGQDDSNVTFDIYTKASYSSPAPSVIASYTVDQLYCPEVTGYEPGPVMMTKNGQDLYITVAQYTKPYFADIDWNNPSDDFITPGNSYKIELYKKGYYDKQPTLVSTTEVPMPAVKEGFVGNAIGLGVFSASGDVSFDFTDDHSVGYILGYTNFDNNFECETYYVIIDKDGKTIRTFGENNQGYILLSPVDGFPEQYAFVDEDPDVVGGLVYNFYDYPSFEHKVTIPCTLIHESVKDGAVLLSMNMDRTPAGKSYNYVFASASGYSEGANTLHEVIWMDPEGECVNVDAINGGELVNMINPYISGHALSPYLFNTDSNREYMVYIHRRHDDSSPRSNTELCIINNEGKMVYQKVFDSSASGIYSALVNAETDPAIWVEYLDTATDTYRSDFITLPFNGLKGEGTKANPYLIENPGDFALIRNDLSAHYRLANDIDFKGNLISPVESAFTGSFDGAGHTMRNFTLNDAALFRTLYSSNASSPCIVYDLTLSGIYARNVPAILCNDNTTNVEISGVHIYNAEVAGDTGKGFGAIIARAGVNSQVSGCSVNIDFDNPSAEYFGGIIGELGRGSNITACSVSGSVKAGANVGGIVAFVNSPSSVIADCHVNLDIEGAHTIGGIAADAARSIFSRNVVEGSIKADKPGRKYSDLAGGFVQVMNVGGVIGDFASPTGSYNDQGTFVPAGTDPIVTGNVVSLSAITIPADDETLLATTHRVIGRSSVNDDPAILKEEWDDEAGKWKFTWGDPAAADVCLADNYVLDNLAVIDSSVGDGPTLTEGASIAADKLDREFFEGLGYKFEGYSVEEPWHYGYNLLPELYFEQTTGASLSFSTESITLAPEEKVTVVLSFEKIDFESINFDDHNGDFIFTPMESQEQNSCPIEIQVLKEGNYTLEASFGQIKAVLAITGRSAISNVIADAASAISYDGYTVSAEGCALEVYNVSGMKVAAGNGAVPVTSLSTGIYVAKATDAEGNVSTLKIAVK